MIYRQGNGSKRPTSNWKGEYLNKNDTKKALPELKKQYEFLKEVDSIALQKSVENLADSYERYYKKLCSSCGYKKDVKHLGLCE